MLKRIQSLPRGQRVLIFVLLFGGGLMLIIAITLFLVLMSLNSAPRSVAESLQDGYTVREFAQLPDDDAYPAAVAVAPDGTVYTGSYDTGAVWSIRDGEVIELDDTRESIGSVAAIEVSSDGTVYVLDRIDSNPRASGGRIWSIDDGVREWATIEDGFVSPDDLTLGPEGWLYAADRGRREIWRFDETGQGELWWTAPESALLTGMTYDPTRDMILVVDAETDLLYGIGEVTDLLYVYDGIDAEKPGLDGVAVAADGTIYLAALDQRAVGVVQDGVLTYIAGNFRGPSDLAYHDGRIYVTNFDSRSLVLPGVEPQRPFALDVIQTS